MILLEIHRWAGIGRDRDLFYLHLRLGFVSVAIDPESVTGVLRDLKVQVKVMKRVLGIADGEGR